MAHTPSVAIIGTGFGGLGMAIHLKKAGYTDITIFEKAGDVGGCWRDNTYPGAACDVPSHVYSFSFEEKTDWSRRFAPQPEILQYLRDTATKYDVRRHIRFNTEVVEAAFDEGAGSWHITLADGSTHDADVLVAATGQLNRPAYPRIPGMDTFAGELFHSARWNHDYDLRGKRVAVIGTGASAIQFVPQIAKNVASLELFQRDAAHVIPKPDYAYHPIARKAFAAVPGLQRLSRWATYCQLEPRAAGFTTFPQLMAPYAARFRRYLRDEVTDVTLREKLTPKDPMGCKRILISNDYYRAMVRDNVDVVTSGITEVRANGIVTADGAFHEVDAIILGTGFQATELLAPMHITGRDGVVLRDEWREGAQAYLGMSVAKFPNLFVLYGPNTNLSHSSIVFMLESQIGYVIQAVRRLAKGDVSWIDVREGVQDAFNTKLQERIRASVWSQGCSSWYKTASGTNPISWPGFTFEYRQRTRKLDESDYHLAPARVPVTVV
ncbi:flavin-containing monooxygenase [Antrihabitans stalactiti]|uniref:NAD(P)/FAD-dependent oxidoreductase n=1 Tax=Antrihabitans stalactiti TaxID=2584121 RepID=A0A848K579_9NOCA|nr:NAD(P)/FAD-dependent oxidoreductase [Antrihabitans stalactiti]NMN93751.1 NAD(P)/FAD-dependent oxidoreductase [Antrihabitans stalactiti]